MKDYFPSDKELLDLALSLGHASLADEIADVIRLQADFLRDHFPDPNADEAL